jgi:VIT1/CCC1 family predicted Fe2+/Mn2+ transporter
MWLLIVVVVLVVLALMFGGFTKGTKSGSAPRFGTSYPMSTYYSG